MASSNTPVELLPFSEVHLANTNVQRAWGELLYRSAEAISSSLAGIEDFANECMYMAVINLKRSTHAFTIGRGRANWHAVRMEAEETHQQDAVGVIYLKSSSLPGTFDIGLSVVPEERGNGWGPHAVRIITKWAFEELHCHRIQARVVESNSHLRDAAIGMFVRMGFNIEGRSSRGLFCPTHPLDNYPEGTTGEWRDVTNLALLDTDWVMYSPVADKTTSFIKSRWDALFAKEERERAELLRFEEHEMQRKQENRMRTSSTEAVRFPFVDVQPTYNSFTPHSNSNLRALDTNRSVWRWDADPASPIQTTLSNFAANSPALPSTSTTTDWQVPQERASPAPSFEPGSPALSYASDIPTERTRSVVDSEVDDNDSLFSCRSSPSPPPHSLLGEGLSDTESVPRSASVVSSNSAASRSDVDGWEFLETASVGSSAVWSASDGEL